MEMLVTVLWFLGMLIALVGGLWLVIIAFKESILWGLGSLLVPFVGIIFAIMHWGKAKVPFLISLAGVVLMILSGLL